jgi:hypothetical protein
VKVVGPIEPTGTAVPMKVHKIDEATIETSLQVSHLASQGKVSRPEDQKSAWRSTPVPSKQVCPSSPIPTSLRINKSIYFHHEREIMSIHPHLK